MEEGVRLEDQKIQERNTVAVYNQICNVTQELYIRTSVLGFRRGRFFFSLHMCILILLSSNLSNSLFG